MANRTNPAAESVSLARGVGQSTEDFQVRRGVKALVASADRVLLVREQHADGTPFWTLPGGGAHPGESIGSTLQREVTEELRCPCVVGDPVASFWYVHQSLRQMASVYTVCACQLAGEPTPARDEVAEVRWVRPSELLSRTLPQVRSVVRHVQPTDARDDRFDA